MGCNLDMMSVDAVQRHRPVEMARHNFVVRVDEVRGARPCGTRNSLALSSLLNMLLSVLRNLLPRVDYCQLPILDLCCLNAVVLHGRCSITVIR